MSWAILAIVVVMLCVGGAIGASYARAQRQWSDYQKTKAGLPGMRSASWVLAKVFASKLAWAVLIVAGLTLYGFVTGGR